MELKAILRNLNNPRLGDVAIELYNPNENYEENIALLEQIRATSATARDCIVEQITSPCQALKRLKGSAVNYDELDYLVRRLDSFDEQELTKFEGAAHLLDLHQIKDMINLTFCCQQATVIDDFHDLKAVGIKHFLTVNGGGAPAYDIARQDGEQIALDLIASGLGQVTPFGVVYKNEMRMEPLYTGYAFPPYADQDYLLELNLMPPPSAAKNMPETVLFLPMSEKRLERMRERAGILTDEDLRLDTWFFEIPEKIANRLDVPNEGLKQLNRFCLAMEAVRWVKLEAVAEFTDARSAAELRYLAENLDLFDFVPNVKSPEEYGRYMIRDSEFFSFDSKLEEFYNYEKYGEERITHEEGRFVEQGYVSYHGSMPLEDLMRDDPAETEQEERGIQMGGMT